MAMEQQTLDSYAAKLSARIDQLKAQDRRIDREAFVAAAEHLPNVVWTAHPDGTIASFNRRYHDLTGLDHYGYTELFHPDDAEACRARWMAHVQSGADYENHCRIKLRDGHYHEMVTRARAIRGADGEIAFWLGSSTITAPMADLATRAA